MIECLESNQKTDRSYCNEGLYYDCEICGRSFEICRESRYMKSRCARCDMLVWSVKEFAKKLCRDTIEISLFNEYLVKSKNWHGKLPDKWLLNQAINAAGYRVAESSTSEPLEIKGKTPHKIYSRRAKQLKNKFERRRLEYSKHKVEPA